MTKIYKVTNKINGKFYIGRTRYKNLYSRKATHKWYAKQGSNLPFPNALRKYGVDGFIWEVLEECEDNMAGQREMYWISELNPYYNATLGGDGGTYGKPCPEHVKEATRKSRIVAVKDKKTGKIYNSMKEAREDTGIMESSISRSIKKNNSKCRWERINNNKK